MISSYDGKISIIYYKDKLKAERDLEIMTMKFDLASQLLLRIKQKEEKFVKQYEFLKLINDNITFTNKNIMDENILLKRQLKKLEKNLIKKFEHKFKNLNNTMMKYNNSMKREIKKSIENKIQLSNQTMIDQNNDVLNNNIKLIENVIQKLFKNIDQLKKEPNSIVKEEKEYSWLRENNFFLKEEEEYSWLKENNFFVKEEEEYSWLKENNFIVKEEEEEGWPNENNSIVKEEEEDDGPKNGTVDICNASEKGSLVGVKYWHALDPSSINRKGGISFSQTPLHYASLNGHLEIVNFLLATGADVDVGDSFTNRTPLMFASTNGHLSVVEALLDNGAEINRQDLHNETPLHLAVKENKLFLVELLIKRGSDTIIRNYQNKTPLDLARQKRFGYIMQCFSSD